MLLSCAAGFHDSEIANFNWTVKCGIKSRCFAAFLHGNNWKWGSTCSPEMISAIAIFTLRRCDPVRLQIVDSRTNSAVFAFGSYSCFMKRKLLISTCIMTVMKLILKRSVSTTFCPCQLRLLDGQSEVLFWIHCELAMRIDCNHFLKLQFNQKKRERVNLCDTGLCGCEGQQVQLTCWREGLPGRVCGCLCE